MTEDEMVGWHQQLNEHGFGWTLGLGDGPTPGGRVASRDAWRAGVHGVTNSRTGLSE